MPAPGAYPIASTADGRVRWSDGSVTGNMSTQQGYAANVRLPGTNNGRFQTPTAPAPAAGGGGNGGGGQPQQSSGQDIMASLQSQADRERQARIDRNRQIADSYKGYAGQLRTSAKSVLDNFLGSLGGFRDRAKTLLGEERDDAFNTAQTQTGQARRDAEDIETKNRNSARARRVGNSSFFDQILSRGNENLGRQFGVIGLNQGSNERAAQNRYQDRFDESNQLEQGAQQQYGQSINAADLIDRAAGIDFEADTNTTTSAFENMLNNARNIQSVLSSYASKVPVAQKTDVDNSGLMAALQGISMPTIAAGNAANASSIADANPVAPTTIEEILRRQQMAALYG